MHVIYIANTLDVVFNPVTIQMFQDLLLLHVLIVSVDVEVLNIDLNCSDKILSFKCGLLLLSGHIFRLLLSQ